MPTIVVLGSGPLGRAVADAATNAGHDARRPRPTDRRPTRPDRLRGRRSRRRGVDRERRARELTSALDAGVRRIVIATTAWDSDRQAVEELVTSRGATVVASANFSLGAALFGRLVEDAVALFGSARLRSIPRRVASGGQTRPAVGHRPRPRSADRRRPSRACARQTTSRSSRSGPVSRPGCTWSGSMRWARPSSCG